ncbi:MAG: undecaprenyl diphosphate synthase family protein, partial [Bacillota bacterium]
MSEESLWLERARESKRPDHIGIIMDGNGRWAQRRGLPRRDGHRAGVESIKRCLPALLELGVPYCSLFVFSTENWRRPRDEVEFL